MAGFQGAMSASLSGMGQSQKLTEVIGANVANAQSPGYKKFESFLQSSTSFSGSSAGGGVSSVMRQQIDQQGSLTSTGVGTDLSIDGNGFFPVASSVNKDGTLGEIQFARSGSFRKNQQDQFITPSGQVLLAWQVDANGNLPETKSLTQSLMPVSISKLISQASATTNVKMGLNLQSQQEVAGGGVATVNIGDRGATASMLNFDINSSDLLTPSGANLNKLTMGEGIDVNFDGKSNKIQYGGLVQTLTFNNAGTELVTGTVRNGYTQTATDTFSITVNSNPVPIQFSRGTGATNLEVLRNIESQINETLGVQKLKARLINDGTTSTIFIAPEDANNGMSFISDISGFGDSIGLSADKQTPVFTKASGSDLIGRFASLNDFKERLTSIGLTVNVFDNDTTGASLVINSSKPTMLNNWNPLGLGSEFLSEFGLKKGYLQSDYDAYDPLNNIAGNMNKNFRPQYSRDFTVYDSMGNAHNMLAAFVKIDTNKWAMEVYAVDRSDVIIPGRTDGLLQACTLTFNGLGYLDSISDAEHSTHSVDISDPNVPLGGTIGQEFIMKSGATTSTFKYGKTYALSSVNIDPTATTLVSGVGGNLATDTFDITIGSNPPISVQRGTGTNDYEVLKNIEYQLNANTALGAPRVKLIYDSLSDRYKLHIKSSDINESVSFSGTNNFDAQLGITSTQNIAANSFETLLELTEQINTTIGNDAVTASIVNGSKSGEYRIKIKPKNPSQPLSFSGDLQVITSPLGKGVSQTIAEALGLKSISEANKIAGPNDSILMTWATTGANPNQINIDYGAVGSIEGLSQVSGDYFVRQITQNGVSTGNLTGFTINDQGSITATFSNGETRVTHQIPIADFPNPNGLIATTGNVFKISDTSGPLNLKEAGKEGAGLVRSASLEDSNIDIATELSQLIITQRQYQASSKVISVVDNLLDNLINRTFS